MHAGEMKNSSTQRALGRKFYAPSAEMIMPAGMHAGEMKNGSTQRALGRKFSSHSAETIMPAGKLNEKCTPARRATAAPSGHSVANSTPPPAKRPCRRGN
ncbi:hypothetical protein [Bianquea renquensis]|uniref:Uncharacterized protein n=1 Tax=Bianquea renquensis TaxID=2763661 RepID=A0A926DVY8_9FIRM|nr:hypothetical protein [Bianquea renquensis]MBC8545081.1 hypothetical protein [Bianquea renquensis]